MSRTKTSKGARPSGASSGKAAKKPDPMLPPVTGFRFAPELLAKLDAHVDELNAAAPRGFRTNRNAVVAAMIEDGLARAAAAKTPSDDTPKG